MYKGDDRMNTRETIGCPQGRLYDVYKGHYRMYTKGTIGCTEGILEESLQKKTFSQNPILYCKL